MKVFIYSVRNVEKAFLSHLLEHTSHQSDFTQDPINTSNIDLCKGSEIICISIQDLLDKTKLEALQIQGIRSVITRSVGFDHIDIDAAKKLGIGIYNIPDYSPNAISEHAIMLLLALKRNFKTANNLNNENDFRLDRLMGGNLQNKAIGIIGLGKIGGSIAKILQGFETNIFIHDPYVDQNEYLDFTFQDFDSLIQNKSAIILSCPLNDSTKHLINERAFDKMSPQTIIINVARGGVIDTKHLIQALENKKIAGAGLDVLEDENKVFFKKHEHSIDHKYFQKLNAFDNVVITPHQAAVTRDSLESRAKSIRKIVESISNNIICKNKLV